MQLSGTKTTLKIPAKLYRIGELVRYSPFSRQTIHNYTVMGLIRETQWTDGGHRLYDESVFERLSKIIVGSTIILSISRRYCSSRSTIGDINSSLSSIS